MSVPFTAQQQAIDVSRRDLDSCVVAGPGSGKTTVLVEYYRRLEDAAARTLQAVEEMRGGRIAPHPDDPDHCRYCDFIDVCRVECGAAAETAEGV